MWRYYCDQFSPPCADLPTAQTLRIKLSPRISRQLSVSPEEHAEPCPTPRSCSIDDMLSLREISDRLEIQQLLVDYSTAVDNRRFDVLDKVFTPDAYIEQRAPA